jgi:hypothetical protein
MNASDLVTVGAGSSRCHDASGRGYVILGWYPQGGRLWPIVVPDVIRLGEPLPRRACPAQGGYTLE